MTQTLTKAHRCDRCRKKGKTFPFWTMGLCKHCHDRWVETWPFVLREFMEGSLYPKDGRLFLADGGSFGGILRVSSGGGTAK